MLWKDTVRSHLEYRLPCAGCFYWKRPYSSSRGDMYFMMGGALMTWTYKYRMLCWRWTFCWGLPQGREGNVPSSWNSCFSFMLSFRQEFGFPQCFGCWDVKWFTIEAATDSKAFLFWVSALQLVDFTCQFKSVDWTVMFPRLCWCFWSLLRNITCFIREKVENSSVGLFYWSNFVVISTSS